MSLEKNQPAEEPVERSSMTPKDAETITSELSADEADQVSGALLPAV